MGAAGSVSTDRSDQSTDSIALAQPAPAPAPPSLRAGRTDGIFVAAVVGISVLTYVTRLGFSSDDWDFLWTMALADDRSPLELLRVMAENPNIAGRPSQNILQVTLFSVFGIDPLGYHVVAALLLVAAAVLLWRCLCLVGSPRAIAVTLALAWALSPAYATNRFWFAAFGYTLAMTACFLSVFADLRAVEGPRVRWGWKAVALAALVVSGLSMEIALPFLAVAPLLVAWTVYRRHGASPLAVYGRTVVPFFALNVVILGAILVFKAETAVGAGLSDTMLGHLKRLGVAAVGVQLGSYGALLPDTAMWALRHTTWAVALVSAAVAVAVALYVRPLLPPVASARTVWIRLAAASAVLFGLGWAVFLTNERFSMTSTGIANRVGMAGALGAAGSVVSGAGLAASLLPARVRVGVGAALFGLLCGTYLLVTATVGEFWVQARSRADHVVEVVAAAVSDRPASTILVDGVCPNVGPAVVFESSWDLAGALRIRFADPTLQADVVSGYLELLDGGFRTTIYGSIVADYAYGPETVLVSYPDGAVMVLGNREAAEAAIASTPFDHERDCPPSQEGHGVDQLLLDRRLHRYRI